MTSRIQSVLFPKEKWDIIHARQWLHTHGFKFNRIHRTSLYLRFRQYDPTNKRKRTISLGKGIKAIVEFD